MYCGAPCRWETHVCIQQALDNIFKQVHGLHDVLILEGKKETILVRDDVVIIIPFIECVFKILLRVFNPEDLLTCLQELLNGDHSIIVPVHFLEKKVIHSHELKD